MHTPNWILFLSAAALCQTATRDQPHGLQWGRGRQSVLPGCHGLLPTPDRWGAGPQGFPVRLWDRGLARQPLFPAAGLPAVHPSGHITLRAAPREGEGQGKREGAAAQEGSRTSRLKSVKVIGFQCLSSPLMWPGGERQQNVSVRREGRISFTYLTTLLLSSRQDNVRGVRV